MRPGLVPGDRLWVDRRAASLGPIEVGSIVVLPDPGRGGRWLVKRVAAVGPSSVFVVRAGVEVRPPGQEAAPPADAIDRSELSESEVYVISDGGPGGRDSRTFGPVPANSLVGVVWWRYFPRDRAGPVPGSAKG
jgi:type IV secretory pathway protease TraF